ncbi:GntR family transcriptional regulator [Streptomyces sp. NBC_00582]|uniref:GntR family transcriptional regulator n=1 Tax=Streptomyces sp. NBC_00582 TaxID=2975783 RepID=UPI002E816035|nr:GntR family transcriptional regulator [Streptomyces sp. NBC_00582]WUB67471.1 GntR family transcriptional regulator [Streptomyces sp. NBC_00582]
MPATDAAVTRTERAYQQIRTDILAGRLRPGSPLRLAALAGEFSVSMSVVREALNRLSGHGLVTTTPNQGFRVTPLSRADLEDLTALRLTLECQALAGSIASADVRWEGEVVSAHHVLERTPISDGRSPGASDEWTEAHAAFHDALVAACGRPRLLALVRSLRDTAEVYRQWAGPLGEKRGRDVEVEHRALMELATARRTEDAVEALRAHIQRTTDILLAQDIAGTDAVPAGDARGSHGAILLR